MLIESNLEAHRQAAGDCISRAHTFGARYADARIVSLRHEKLAARESRISEASSTLSCGIGIRVIVDDAWGFAAAPLADPSLISQLLTRACEQARQYGRLRRTALHWSEAASIQASWQTPLLRDPFDIPVAEKTSLLLSLNAVAAQAGAQFCESFLWAVAEDKLFLSSQGSQIAQRLTRIWCEATPVVVDSAHGRFESRRLPTTPVGMGYEYVERFPYHEEMRSAVEHAKMKLKAPSVAPGRYDLILDPAHLWLTIHETCGHATELDRALGYEANYAGTSFLSPDMLGHFRYGSPMVNIQADRSQPGALATCGYDDDGVAAQSFPIISEGIFTNFQTTREYASLIGASHSLGCASAESWSCVPLQRMPNISLQPGRADLSLQTLINGTDRGILIKGDGSWSIDQQRRNFQFTGQEFWEIRHGKITGMLRDVAYQGETPSFWNSCDAICDASSYELHGSFFCGKGQPPQCAAVSHGSSPARFRNVQVINTRGIAAR